MVGDQAGRELVDLTCQVTSECHVAEIDARLGDGDNGGSDALAIHHGKGGLHVPSRIIDSRNRIRSEEHTSELHHQIISYAVFCLKKKKKITRRIRYIAE